MWATGDRVRLYVERHQGDEVEVINKGSNTNVADAYGQSPRPWSTYWVVTIGNPERGAVRIRPIYGGKRAAIARWPSVTLLTRVHRAAPLIEGGILSAMV